MNAKILRFKPKVDTAIDDLRKKEKVWMATFDLVMTLIGVVSICALIFLLVHFFHLTEVMK